MEGEWAKERIYHSRETQLKPNIKYERNYYDGIKY